MTRLRRCAYSIRRGITTAHSCSFCRGGKIFLKSAFYIGRERARAYKSISWEIFVFELWSLFCWFGKLEDLNEEDTFGNSVLSERELFFFFYHE